MAGSQILKGALSPVQVFDDIDIKWLEYWYLIELTINSIQKEVYPEHITQVIHTYDLK